MTKPIRVGEGKYFAVQRWLERRIKISLICNFFVLIGWLVVEGLVLAVTAWVVCAGLIFCFFAIGALINLSGLQITWLHHGISLGGATVAVIILIFVQYFRTGEVDFNEFPRVSRRSNLFKPGVWVATSKFLVSCLYSAPRLLVPAGQLILKSWRLLQMEARDCAKVLAVLALANGGLTYREICEWIANLNPVVIFPQLKALDGVLFLTDGGKLTLTPDLRAEIRTLLAASGYIEIEQEFEGANADDAEPINNEDEESLNYRVLGVRPSISLEELKIVYRRLMKENHPDLVSKPGLEELKALAEERTKRINEAYHAILAERGR